VGSDGDAAEDRKLWNNSGELAIFPVDQLEVTEQAARRPIPRGSKGEGDESGSLTAR